MATTDIWAPPERHEYVRVRVERTQKFGSRQLMDASRALGGYTLEELGVDADAPLSEGAKAVIKKWAASTNGIMGYASQWGMLEKEVLVYDHIRVFVDGELVHEEHKEATHE